MPSPTSEANSEAVSTTESARQPFSESTFALADASELTFSAAGVTLRHHVLHPLDEAASPRS